MCLAKDRDVDMVLLSGDLFHDNKPSRKAMYQVMKTLRQNCYGEKPCEIEVLSDTSQEFQSAGGHVNYEDPDINVAIPVFSIHGNHDDPSGVGTERFLCILIVAVWWGNLMAHLRWDFCHIHKITHLYITLFLRFLSLVSPFP